MLHKFTLLLLFIVSTSTFSGFHEKNRPYGHNISHTDYFPEKSCSVGLQVLACGAETWAIGTSPFLIGIYNMANIYFIKRLDREITGNKKTIQLAYFDTFNETDQISKNNPKFRLNTTYQQKSVMAYYIYSQDIRPNYRLHWNTSASYFFDEKHPFSIRRPTYYRRQYQLNFTTLHEVKMTEYLGIQGELGVIHLEDRYPRFHTGASLFYKSKHWLVQLGFTLTGTIDGLFVSPDQPSRHDYQQELRSRTSGYDGPFDKDKIKDDFSMHPEIAIQYLF